MTYFPIVNKQRFKVFCFLLACVALAAIDGTSDAQPAFEWEDLKKEPALARKVNLECSRRGLDSVLKEAAEQTGVQLSLTEKSALSAKKVTARIKDMNLYDFMSALARTYVAEWRKSQTGSYVLRPQTTDEALIGAAQIGTGVFYQYRNRIQPGLGEIIQRRGGLYEQIVAEVGVEKLQEKGGTPFSSLGPETAAALRSEYELEGSSSLLNSFTMHKPAWSTDGIIRLKMNRNPQGNEELPLQQPDVLTLEILDGKKNQINHQYPLRWEVKSVLPEKDNPEKDDN